MRQDEISGVKQAIDRQAAVKNMHIKNLQKTARIIAENHKLHLQAQHDHTAGNQAKRIGELFFMDDGQGDQKP